MKKNLMRKGLLLLTGLLLTVGMMKTRALAAEVAVNETTFPDPAFRAYVLSEFDNNHDYKLSQSEIEAATSIYCPGSYDALGSIQTLQGIEYLTELDSLSCSYNQITNLDLSSNTKLTGLYCDANPLTGLNISSLVNLQWLNCSGCGLYSLDLSALTELAVLHCSNNHLTSLDLHNNTKLATLGCSMNDLGSIDLSNNTQLGSLQLQLNHLNVVDIRNNPTLINIYQNGNGPVPDYVGCCYELDYNFVWTDADVLVVTEVPSGSYLINAWAEPAMCGNVSGYGVYQSGKTVTLKAEANFGYVFKGWVENGQVVSTNPNPSFKAKKDRNVCAKFEVDPAYANGILIDAQSFPDATFRALVKAEFDSDHNDRLSLEELENVTYIACAGDYDAPGSITTLKGIEYFGNLETLSCSYNQIASLDVSHNKKLDFLDCSNNSISTLDLSGNGRLTVLNCDYNQITSLNLSGASSLDCIYCGGNALQSLDLSACGSLQMCSCTSNQLTSLDVSSCTILRYLDCAWNDLTTLDISHCEPLNAIVLSTDGVQAYGRVEYLTVDYNGLRLDEEVELVTTDGTLPAWLTGWISLSGYLCYGGTMTCEVYDTNNTGTLYYQWLRNGSPISGATQQSYTCVAADIGKALGIIVTSSSLQGQLVYDFDDFIVDKGNSPEPPTGLTTQYATAETSKDGKIFGTTTAMEYADNIEFTGAKTCKNGETTGLAHGFYYVRFKETSTTYAGLAQYVFIGVKEYFDPVIMVNAKVAFNGKVGLVFGVIIPDWLKEDADAFAIVTVAGQEYRKSLADIVAAGTAEDGTYRIAQYVPSVYYRENMNLRIYSGYAMRAPLQGQVSGSDLTENGINYSIEKYVTSVKNSGASGNAVNLVKALEDYCTAAQIQFDYNSAGLSVSSAVTNLSPSVLSGYGSTGSENFITGITGKKLTVSFEADNSIKVGFVFASGVNPSSYKYYVDKKPAKLKYSEHFGYYIMAKNIPAAYLHLPHEFKVKKGTETYIVNCSALTYAKAIVGSADTKVSNLAKALYLYNQAAKAYFGVE